MSRDEFDRLFTKTLKESPQSRQVEVSGQVFLAGSDEQDAYHREGAALFSILQLTLGAAFVLTLVATAYLSLLLVRAILA